MYKDLSVTRFSHIGKYFSNLAFDGICTMDLESSDCLRIYFLLEEEKLHRGPVNCPLHSFSQTDGFSDEAINGPGPEPACIKDGTKSRRSSPVTTLTLDILLCICERNICTPRKKYSRNVVMVPS